MNQTESLESITPPAGQKCLIVRRGAARRSVVALRAGEITTVGRAHANRIVIPDAKCSRHHCEIFCSEGAWQVRDLASRNGVLVDGIRIEREQPLVEGQILTIGNCEIEFTTPPAGRQGLGASLLDDTGSESFDIIERKSGTQYDRPSELLHEPGRTKPGLPELYQLAQSMAQAGDIESLAERTLDGLFAGTTAVIGAVLVLPVAGEAPEVERLECVASRSPQVGTPPEVSRYLSELVLTDHEAVLARDLAQHDALAQRDSLGKLAARSAICAPIRRERRLLGLVHLYSTRTDRLLDSGDLEFTLAVADQFAIALDNVRDRDALAEGLSRAEEENLDLRQQLEVETELIGNSSVMQDLRQTIGRIAPTEATVLIRGESGVGKELVARAVHFNSPRRDGAFVCVNCAALTESLLESELFGHERGAFTGASGQKIGKFEQAHCGTLFLDEIGEMSPEVQAKFLRVLEGHSFERVGGSKAIEVDVRVVTATNRNLEEAVRQGSFRQDLYFRLQVIEVFVPPLREHPDDIPIIAEHFLRRLAGRSRVRAQGFSPQALEVLRQYDWPGNVRELKNVVERSLILSDHPVLTADDIRLLNLERAAALERLPAAPEVAPVPVGTAAASAPPAEQVDIWAGLARQEPTLGDVEREYIAATLERHNWNKSATARQLGIERTTLDRKLKKYDINREGDDD